jgi:hypothetical protein
MKITKPVVAVLVAASVMMAPAVHAKKTKKSNNATALVNASAQANANSQAGGLPATNARVTALEAAVAALQTGLAAEIEARKAADAELTAALNAEIAARQAADTALSNQLAAIPVVFVTDGSVSNIEGTTATVASKTVPAGTYFFQAAVQMVNSQASGDANARCILRADDQLLADTADLEFPVLTGSTPNAALGSTMFAPLHGSYSSTSPITVLVECTESNGDNGGLDAYAHIAALKAGTLE